MCSTAHWQLGDVMVSDITFLWFLLFLMCQSLHVTVNKCIIWCFVHFISVISCQLSPPPLFAVGYRQWQLCGCLVLAVGDYLRSRLAYPAVTAEACEWPSDRQVTWSAIKSWFHACPSGRDKIARDLSRSR